MPRAPLARRLAGHAPRIASLFPGGVGRRARGQVAAAFPAAQRLDELAARLSSHGVRIEARRIAPGDEAAFPEPSEPLIRRRASGAARLAARAALAGLGGPLDAALARSPGGFPLWP